MKNFEEKYFCWKWLVSNPDILSFTLRFDKRGQFKRPKFWADLANVAKNYEGLKLFIKMSLSAPEKLLDIMWHFLFPKVRMKNKISGKFFFWKFKGETKFYHKCPKFYIIERPLVHSWTSLLRIFTLLVTWLSPYVIF